MEEILNKLDKLELLICARNKNLDRLNDLNRQLRELIARLKKEDLHE